MLRAGITGLRRHLWAWLVMAHVSLGAVLVVYFMMVAGNSLAYGYSYWHEPPPSEAGEIAAVVSLLALFLVTCVIGVIAYGWMCRYALAAREEVGVGIVTALRGALGPAMRTSWFAVPAFAATAIGTMLVVPGLVLIAVLGTLPFPFLAKVPRPAVQHFRLVGRFDGQVIAVGALAVLVAIPF